jgi:hypothetical protein
MNDYPTMQERLDSALSALNRMTDQRDQLEAQLKDATEQLARAGDLLHMARNEIMALAYPVLPSLTDNIAGYLNGDVLPPHGAYAEATTEKRPAIVDTNGDENDGFSVRFPNGLLGTAAMDFRGLHIEGDGVSGAHICVLLAASNWLSDEAHRWLENSKVVIKPRIDFRNGSAPKPEGK